MNQQVDLQFRASNASNVHRCAVCLLVAVVAVPWLSGCAGPRGGSSRGVGGPSIRKVACLYGQSPWLSFDAAGDRDPEGVQFRVFLDPGSGRGIARTGTLHMEMYQLTRTSMTEPPTRTLVSDWHYSTKDIPRVRSKFLGIGYLLRLRWAQKELAGHEVELITRFEYGDGFKVSSATKRLRIPKHTP